MTAGPGGRDGGDDDRDGDGPGTEAPDEGSATQPGDDYRGVLGVVRAVLDAIADADRGGHQSFRAGGRLPGGHFRTEYGISGRIGLGPGGARPGMDRGDRDRTGGEGDPGSSRSRADADLEGADYRVDSRYDEASDELVVVADLPGVDHEDLRAAVDQDSDELVIQVDDRTLDRLDLPWPAERVEGRFRHGILELRFEPAEE